LVRIGKDCPRDTGARFRPGRPEAPEDIIFLRE
jgi:hypothetical protein